MSAAYRTNVAPFGACAIRCGDCLEIVPPARLVEPRRLWERLDLGTGIMPSGECPTCEALCYPDGALAPCAEASGTAECVSCGTLTAEEKLGCASRLLRRLAPGDLVPSGSCPRCGGLCHPPGAWDDYLRRNGGRDVLDAPADERPTGRTRGARRRLPRRSDQGGER